MTVMLQENPSVFTEPRRSGRAPASVQSCLRESEGTNQPGPQGAAVRFKVASRRDEVYSALRLVHDAYVRLGLIRPNSHGLHVTGHHNLPSTEVLIAIRQREVLCTMTVITDFTHQLPLESIYREEVASFRANRRCLAEIGCLASQPEHSEAAGDLFRLMANAIQRCKENRADAILIAVHQRHARFYERFLGFQPFGREKPYERVSGRPAVALALQFEGLEARNPRAYRRIFFSTPRLEDAVDSPRNPSSILAGLPALASSLHPQVIEDYSPSEIAMQQADRMCA